MYKVGKACLACPRGYSCDDGLCSKGATKKQPQRPSTGKAKSVKISTSEYDQFKEYAVYMGVYDYNSKTGVYQQRSSGKPRYLFTTDDKKLCMVGSNPEKSVGWLSSSSTCSSLPTSGWEFWSSDNNKWISDDSIGVYEGDMNPCSTISITVTGAAEYQSECCRSKFKLTNSWLNGRAVYTNGEGNKLHFSDDGVWKVGSEYNKYRIKSSDGPLYASNAKKWKFWDGKTDKSANVEITC